MPGFSAGGRRGSLEVSASAPATVSLRAENQTQWRVVGQTPLLTEGLETGPWTVRAVALDPASGVAADQYALVRDGEVTPVAFAFTPPGGKVRVYVRADHWYTRIGFRGLSVYLTQGDRQVRGTFLAAPEGWVEFENVPPGTYRTSVRWHAHNPIARVDYQYWFESPAPEFVVRAGAVVETARTYDVLTTESQHGAPSGVAPGRFFTADELRAYAGRDNADSAHGFGWHYLVYAEGGRSVGVTADWVVTSQFPGYQPSFPLAPGEKVSIFSVRAGRDYGGSREVARVEHYARDLVYRPVVPGSTQVDWLAGGTQTVSTTLAPGEGLFVYVWSRAWNGSSILRNPVVS